MEKSCIGLIRLEARGSRLEDLIYKNHKNHKIYLAPKALIIFLIKMRRLFGGMKENL